MSLNLPPAVPKPCNDCPWRLNATPGWLGAHPAEDWIEMIHGEAPIACHQTIPPGTSDLESAEEAWAQDGIRQCAGAALFRVNVYKSPRNPSDAEHAVDVDDPLLATVFPDDAAFINYHAQKRSPATRHTRGGHPRGGRRQKPR